MTGTIILLFAASSECVELGDTSATLVIEATKILGFFARSAGGRHRSDKGKCVVGYKHLGTACVVEERIDLANLRVVVNKITEGGIIERGKLK